MMSLRLLSVLLLALIVLGNGAPPVALASDGNQVAEPDDSSSAAASFAETIYYMNKSASQPNIDGVWDAAAWQKGRMYA
mgnify:CR=1 FL=1